MITPLPAGGSFAGYQVDAVLARGGMGVVYLATEQRPRRRVALKLIAPALAADPAYRERFLREVDALASLEHPNVVPIHAAGEWEGQLYLAMRYLDGPDLAEIVRTRGPLPPDEALALLAPIADALDVAHARGIVHRDVTPSNIRLDARGIPYLTDFGLTKRAATSGAGPLTLGPMGTPAYMAPEQFATDAAAPAPDPALAPRVDVYALGCVLVTLLTGTPPYPRDSYEAALWAHVHADPPAISERRAGLPPALDAVVARALAKDPAARHGSAGALVVAARAALAGPVPVAAAPVLAGQTTAVVPAAALSSSDAQAASPRRPAAPPAAPAGSPAAARGARRSRTLVGVTARAIGALLLVVLAAGSGIGAGLLLAGGVGPGLIGFGGTATPAPTARPTPAPTPAPTPTPTPTPTPMPTPEPTPTPSPTPRVGSPEDVARLRAWIPRSIRQDCESTTLRSVDEVAAVRCTADDVSVLRYGLFRSADRLALRWDDWVTRQEVAPGGRCESGEEAVGTWGDEGLFGFFGETRGDIVCTVTANGSARVDWTTVDAPIWTTIQRSDEDIAAVYATWSEGKLNPLRSPR